MRKLFSRANVLTATFCERCGRACDAGCFQAAMRDRLLLQRLWLGVQA